MTWRLVAWRPLQHRGRRQRRWALLLFVSDAAYLFCTTFEQNQQCYPSSPSSSLLFPSKQNPLTMNEAGSIFQQERSTLFDCETFYKLIFRCLWKLACFVHLFCWKPLLWLRAEAILVRVHWSRKKQKWSWYAKVRFSAFLSNIVRDSWSTFVSIKRFGGWADVMTEIAGTIRSLKDLIQNLSECKFSRTYQNWIVSFQLLTPKYPLILYPHGPSYIRIQMAFFFRSVISYQKSNVILRDRWFNVSNSDKTRKRWWSAPTLTYPAIVKILSPVS